MWCLKTIYFKIRSNFKPITTVITKMSINIGNYCMYLYGSKNDKPRRNRQPGQIEKMCLR